MRKIWRSYLLASIQNLGVDLKFIFNRKGAETQRKMNVLSRQKSVLCPTGVDIMNIQGISNDDRIR